MSGASARIPLVVELLVPFINEDPHRNQYLQASARDNLLLRLLHWFRFRLHGSPHRFESDIDRVLTGDTDDDPVKCSVFWYGPSVFINGTRGRDRVISRTRPHGIPIQLSFESSAFVRS